MIASLHVRLKHRITRGIAIAPSLALNATVACKLQPVHFSR